MILGLCYDVDVIGVATTIPQQNRHSVAAEVYRRKKGVGVGDELRNRRIAATILSDYKENGGTRP